MRDVETLFGGSLRLGVTSLSIGHRLTLDRTARELTDVPIVIALHLVELHFDLNLRERHVLCQRGHPRLLAQHRVESVKAHFTVLCDLHLEIGAVFSINFDSI